MTATITLTEEDYFIHYLYLASGSLNNRIINTRLFYGLLLIFIGINFSWLDGGIGHFYVFLVLGLCMLFFYPTVERHRIRKAYRKLIQAKYKYINKPFTYFFNVETLHYQSDVSESKIKASEIQKIFELTDYYIIEMPSNHSMMIPKNQIDNYSFSQFLNKMESRHGIKLVDHTMWKW